MTKSLKTLHRAMMTAMAIIVTLLCTSPALAWPHPWEATKRAVKGVVEVGKDTLEANQARERFTRHMEQYFNELGFADLIGRNFQHRAFILLTWMGISLLLSGKKREKMSGFGLWFCTVVGYAGGVVAGGAFELYRSSGQLSEYVQWAWILPGVVMTGGIIAHSNMLLPALRAFSPKRFHYYLWPLWIGVSGLDVKETPATPPTPSKETEGPHVLHVEAAQPSAPTPEVPAVTAGAPPAVAESQPVAVTAPVAPPAPPPTTAPVAPVVVIPLLPLCPVCGKLTRAGEFCGKCGAPTHRNVLPSVTCPACGKLTRAGEFCGQCGSSLKVGPDETRKEKSGIPGIKPWEETN